MTANTTDANAARAEFLETLGLSLPISEEDVQQAFLERVKSVHPDRGGTVEEFRRLERAYKQALQYARFRQGRRQWLRMVVDRYIHREKIIEEVKRLGGNVELEHVEWIKDDIGEDFAQMTERIIAIRVHGSSVDDRFIGTLQQHRMALDGLSELDLSSTAVTNEGVVQLGAFAYLRRLDLRDTSIDNTALTVLNSLRELEWLGLDGTQVNLLGRLMLGITRPFLLVHWGGRAVRASALLHRLLLVACAIYVALIFTATHVPIDVVEAPHWPVPIDKLVHLMMFAGLGFLGRAIITVSTPTPRRRSRAHRALIIAWLWLWIALYGLADELSQSLVGRSFDWYDWLADLAGVGVGLLMFAVFRTIVRTLAPNIWSLSDAELAALDHRRSLERLLSSLAES